MESLFPSNPTHGAGQANDRNNVTIHTFKAGWVDLEGPKANGNFSATADKRKGSLSLVFNSEEQITRLRWIDRRSGVVQEERMPFPGDIIFKKANTGRPTDRVYVAAFTDHPDRKPLMFWMQDKSDEQDAANCEKMNNLLNTPGQALAASRIARTAARTGRAGGAQESDAAGDLSALLASLGVDPAAAAAAAAVTATGAGTAGAGAAARGSAGPLSLESMRAALAASRAGAGAGAGAAAAGGAGAAASSSASASASAAPEPVQLQEALNADAVIATGILSDATLCQQLLAHLPPRPADSPLTDTQYLQAVLRTPQLADSMRALSEALQGENYNAVMGNFGLNPALGMPALMRGQAVEAFLTAVQALDPVQVTAAADEAAGSGSGSGAGAGAGAGAGSRMDESKD